MNRTEKQDQIESLRDQFERSSFSVVAAYEGLTVAQLTDLRTELRKVDGQFRVVKNTLAKLALADQDLTDFTGHFKGAVGVVFSYGDPAAAAKALKEFSKEAKAFSVSAGVIDGAVVDANGVKAIADLPSREELLGRMCGSMMSPVSGFVRVLSGTLGQMVYVLSAIADKKAA